jgi:hypothetical protein
MKSAADVKTAEKGMSISAPVAANITIGAQVASTKTGTAAKRNGTNFTVAYALSKRTSINLQLKSFDGTTSAVTGKDNRLGLVHTF